MYWYNKEKCHKERLLKSPRHHVKANPPNTDYTIELHIIQLKKTNSIQSNHDLPINFFTLNSKFVIQYVVRTFTGKIFQESTLGWK